MPNAAVNLGRAVVNEVRARIAAKASSPLWFFSEWFTCGPLKAYMRFGKTNVCGVVVTCITLANIEVNLGHQRKGHASSLLDAMEALADENSYTVYVENVFNLHLRETLKRRQYRIHDTGWGEAICYYRLPGQK